MTSKLQIEKNSFVHHDKFDKKRSNNKFDEETICFVSCSQDDGVRNGRAPTH